MFSWRRYSGRAFGAAEWARAQTTQGLLQLLHEYRAWDAAKQQAACAAAPPDIVPSLQLVLLLETGSNERIFTHIANHATLHEPLVEDFLFRLVAEGQLDAASVLLHKVLHRNHSVLDQFWGVLAAEAAEEAHYPAAQIVLHELVAASCKPFLLLPTSLQRLALVFVQNGDAEAVEALRRYFKRHYLYLGHRDTYRALGCAQVEAYARASEFEKARDAFAHLAHKFMGHYRYQDPKTVLGQLKRNVFENAQERSASIARGGPAVYNNYRRPNGKPLAMLDGYLRIADLPVFGDLLRERVHAALDSASTMNQIFSLVSLCHHSLHRFVVAALCECGHVTEAWTLIEKLPSLYPRISHKVLFRGDDSFVALNLALCEKLKAGKTSYARILSKSQAFSSSWTDKCRGTHLAALQCVPEGHSEAERYAKRFPNCMKYVASRCEAD